MPIRKIAELSNRGGCNDPDHKPTSFKGLDPGKYEHECPKCKFKTRFIIPERPPEKAKEPTEENSPAS
jgi:hypothetical protein